MINLSFLQPSENERQSVIENMLWAIKIITHSENHYADEIYEVVTQ